MKKPSYAVLSVGALCAAALVLTLRQPRPDAEPAAAAALAAPVRATAPDSARTRARTLSSTSAARAGLISTHVLTDVEIDAMETSQLQSEAALVDDELAEAHAIERLNSDEVSEDERDRLGLLLERGARLRAALAERDLDDVMDAVDAYAATHERRVAELLQAD